MTQAIPAGAASAAVARAGWQGVVFAAEPSRLAVLSLRPDWPLTPLRIAIFRNSGVEIFTAPLTEFLAYAGFAAEFDIGDYDDSLSFQGGGDAAIELVWLDVTRYVMPRADLGLWLSDRLTSRRQAHTSPIVVGLVGRNLEEDSALEAALTDATSALGGVFVCDISGVAKDLGPGFRSERTGSVTASPMSNRAAMQIARRLGFEWMPSLLLPRIKAIAVDLDGTLYAGVLGEDGVGNVTMTPDFRRVQEALRSHGRAGVLLVLVSKNTPEDVERLFEVRTDFVLKRSDFVDTQIGWADKAASIEQAAERLRIAPDAFLLVDDNLGEIAATAAANLGIGTLLAVDPAEASRALAIYPGLVGYPASDTDQVRAKDLAAARIREEAFVGAEPSADYLRSLNVTLTLAEDPLDLLGRLHELSMKTNQFNTALSRFSEAEIARRLGASDCCVVSVALKDRLSDSGVIAAIQTHREGPELLVDEIAISCRALGRNLEDSIISAALVRSAHNLGVSRVRVVVHDGPRNDPARTWASTLAEDLQVDGSVPVEVFESRLASFGDAVDVVWTHAA